MKTNQTHSSKAELRIAMILAKLQSCDRRWVLARLPEANKRRLVAVLELVLKNIVKKQWHQFDVKIEIHNLAIKIENPQDNQYYFLVNALSQEPALVIAAVLTAENCPWVKKFEQMCDAPLWNEILKAKTEILPKIKAKTLKILVDVWHQKIFLQQKNTQSSKFESYLEGI